MKNGKCSTCSDTIMRFRILPEKPVFDHFAAQNPPILTTNVTVADTERAISTKPHAAA